MSIDLLRSSQMSLILRTGYSIFSLSSILPYITHLNILRENVILLSINLIPGYLSPIIFLMMHINISNVVKLNAAVLLACNSLIKLLKNISIMFLTYYFSMPSQQNNINIFSDVIKILPIYITNKQLKTNQSSI